MSKQANTPVFKLLFFNEKIKDVPLVNIINK